ncbi:transposase [soil metagenome]
MTYDALRTGRASLPGHAYVVTTVTARRVPWFGNLTTARAMIREMQRLEEEGMIVSLAWVLMPDHLHWLIQLSTSSQKESTMPDSVVDGRIAPNLSTIMRLFKGRSARVVNQILHRHGPIWQRAFYDRAVREHEDLQRIARYLAENPLRAGLADSLADYPHWDAVWINEFM